MLERQRMVCGAIVHPMKGAAAPVHTVESLKNRMHSTSPIEYLRSQEPTDLIIADHRDMDTDMDMDREQGSSRFTGRRRELIQRLFPHGIPTLWCPLLTHYTREGAIDKPRIAKHLDFLQPWVKGYLIPGSTGDAWQLSDGEIEELVEFALDQVQERKAHLLIGVLKGETQQMVESIRNTVSRLKQRTGTQSDEDCLLRSSVSGFTVCPPKGRALTQAEIRASLDAVLELGFPTSLYQLPQVTENEMSPATVAKIAAAHPNFYLFKDTSGGDRVASSGFRDVFLVRGAEGDYSAHLANNGGRYDGFLLSTASCFGREFHRLIEDLKLGKMAEAEALSNRLTLLVNEVFAAAAKLSYGNAFTNANKAMDHFFAHGPQARKAPPPRLHSGDLLSPELIETAGAALSRYELMPARGYLE